ncbi:hypothetical protein A9Q93_12930 [Nonlabens dokdonensis]|uniref:DNA primase n=1 Tax=Nonlabens dokdonensis TaxID=328515 RepID=A0A1Z8AJD1_9FLAO|nr:DUF6371 domain-containing protein [Nonlabens dokdonensis]OUS10452.1 hypothetical protein A9Q93_12930 [Nonlabens dokdonensis]
MKYRYALNSSKGKFTCPKCSHKNRFSRYWDKEKQQFISTDVGKCDRPTCGYHLTPKDHFQNTGVNFTSQFSNNYIPLPPAPKDYLNTSLISKYANSYSNNNFISFLCKIFEKPVVKKIILRYLLGSINKPWKDSIIFWEIDNKGILRYGKIMTYHSHNGKRVKEPYNHVGSFHKVYHGKDRNYNYDRCLFGLHLINEDFSKPIAIVESEKTAIIMSEIDPKYIWLACGSINGINEHMFNPISHRKIILFPDLSLPNDKGKTALDYWTEKANKLIKLGFKITVSTFLYVLADPKEKEIGFDIADYYINELLASKQKFTTQEIPKREILLTKKEKQLAALICKNAAVQSLIDTFQLEIE